MKRSSAIFFRLCVILITVLICFFLFRSHLIYTTIFVFIVLIVLTLELHFFIKNTFLFYDKTIQSILQDDFSADFSQNQSQENFANLFELYNRLKTSKNEQISRDIIYRSILNTIETGIVILQKDNTDWNIFLMNDYFSNHFEVPKVSQWRYLKNQLPSLCNLIEENGFEEVKTSLQIRVNQRDTQTFVLQTSASKTFNEEYYIIVLDSIQKVIEKKEKEAWVNLMKVISHELLNSLTPIRSLSQNLHELVLQESLSQDDLEDMKESVSAILNRSNHLQLFVESYRKLAMLPSPKKVKTEISQLIETSLKVMNPLFKKENISVINSINFQRWLMIDSQQIEQVLINLLTNCMYALEEVEQKQIMISAESKNKRFFITITDSGKGIEKEIEDKIFLPFFTTRKEGAGIGLTLSKNIVEAHGGYLIHQQNEDSTTFILCLIE